MNSQNGTSRALRSGTYLLTDTLDHRDFHTGEHETVSWLELDDHGPSITSIPDSSPCRIAFSGPLLGYESLLAVGYRSHPVLIWDTMELQLLGTCETVSTNGVSAMVFNPNDEIPALVVSYADGSLRVFDYRTPKLDSSRSDVCANSLSCSKDGRSLVCGTSHGTIHIFEFDKGYTGNIVLTPIHRINCSHQDAIRGVAFHFEGLRFVDITRHQCRVWEPAALVGRSNEVESTSDVVSGLHKTAGSVISPDKPLISTPLAATKDGRFITGGNDHGQVIVFSTDYGSELGTAYSHTRGASVRLVTVADSSSVVASADDSGRIIVAELPRSLQSDPGESSSQDLALNVVFDQQLGRAVVQLLISPEADRLLVVLWEATELWDLPQGILLGRHRLAVDHTLTREHIDFSPSTRSTVVQHPSNPTLFISVTGGIGRKFSWIDFKELTSPDGIQILHPTYLHLSTLGDELYHPIPGVGILDHRLPSPSCAGQLILWPTAAFDENSDVSGRPLEVDGLEALGPMVYSVLGVIGSTRVVFLDTDLWVCSFDLQLSLAAGVHSRGRGPGFLSGRPGTSVPDQNMIGCVRRHFFALSEWRDGSNKFNPLMVPSTARSANSSGYSFAFGAGHRVVLVQGGMDFSETVTLDSSGRASRPEGVRGTTDTGKPPAKSSSDQQWTVVSGSMHRRSPIW